MTTVDQTIDVPVPPGAQPDMWTGGQREVYSIAGAEGGTALTATRSLTFEEIVAGWNQYLPCIWRTKSGRNCKRPARWRVDVHDCACGEICSHHFNSIVREAESILHPDGNPCDSCRRIFHAVLGEFITAVPL